MNILQKKYFWIVDLLLIAALAYVSANIFLAYISSRIAVSDRSYVEEHREKAVSERKKPFSYYSIIEKRNIFNSSRSIQKGGETVSEEAKAQTAPVVTKLNLKLVGTVVGEGFDSYAIIENIDQRNQDVYRLGDMVVSAKLIEIHRNMVVLLNRGKRESLYAFEEKSKEKGIKTSQRTVPEKSSTKGEAIVKVDDNTWRVSREQVAETIGDVNRFMTQVRVNPHFENGKPAGYRLSWIRRGSLLADIGLRSGDVLKKINGIEINTPDEAFQAYQQFQNESSIRLEVERRKQMQTFTYEIR